MAAAASPCPEHPPSPPSVSGRPSLRAHAGGRTTGPAAGDHPPERPEPGTRVVLIGQDRHGEVKPYQAGLAHRSFPVCFDDCQWRIMTAADLVLETSS